MLSTLYIQQFYGVDKNKNKYTYIKYKSPQ